jgi:hypothetical protein
MGVVRASLDNGPPEPWRIEIRSPAIDDAKPLRDPYEPPVREDFPDEEAWEETLLRWAKTFGRSAARRAAMTTDSPHASGASS